MNEKEPFKRDGVVINPSHDYTITCVEGRHQECLGWVAPLSLPDHECRCNCPPHETNRLTYIEALKATLRTVRR